MREVVEKGLVFRGVSGGAKVVRSRDKALTKEPVPNPVDHYPRCEWVSGGGHPFCKFKATALVCDFAWSRGCSNGGEEASRDCVSELVWIPSDIDPRVRDFSISHSHDLGELFLFACFQG